MSDVLQETQENLSEILKPFQKEVNQQQRKAEFLKKCIRCVERNDFFQLGDLLKSKVASDIEITEGLEGCEEQFNALRAYTDEQLDLYSTQFVDDIIQLAEENELELEVDLPRLTSYVGIEGEIDFANRCTTLNKKIFKTIDPQRIITTILKLKAHLYDRPYDPQIFIDKLEEIYERTAKKEETSLGDPVPIQSFYWEYVIDLQTKTFVQSIEKGKFRGYDIDQFSVDLWRYFEAGIGGTSTGKSLQLKPGRNKSLWLLDSQGEKRHITGISFK